MIARELPRTAYRCTVVPENSAGVLKLGWHNFAVRVIDTSREAFTIEVQASIFRRLREGRRAILKFNGEIWQVQCTAVFQIPDGQFSVTLTRVRDLTQVRGPRTTIWSLLPMPNPSADPVLPLALLISFLFACVALPGMGDQLGTAPKIRQVIQDAWRATTNW